MPPRWTASWAASTSVARVASKKAKRCRKTPLSPDRPIYRVWSRLNAPLHQALYASDEDALRKSRTRDAYGLLSTRVSAPISQSVLRQMAFGARPGPIRTTCGSSSRTLLVNATARRHRISRPSLATRQRRHVPSRCAARRARRTSWRSLCGTDSAMWRRSTLTRMHWHGCLP